MRSPTNDDSQKPSTSTNDRVEKSILSKNLKAKEQRSNLSSTKVKKQTKNFHKLCP